MLSLGSSERTCLAWEEARAKARGPLEATPVDLGKEWISGAMRVHWRRFWRNDPVGACLKRLAPAAEREVDCRGESEWPLQKDEGVPAV